MRLSREGKIELIGYEGFVLAPDGRNQDLWRLSIGRNQRISEPVIDAKLPVVKLLGKVAPLVRRCEREVLSVLQVPVSQTEFDALVSFHYDTRGIRRAALVKSLNRLDRTLASKQFLNWGKSGVETDRRARERKLFSKGIYSNGRMARLHFAGQRKIQKTHMYGTIIDLDAVL